MYNPAKHKKQKYYLVRTTNQGPVLQCIRLSQCLLDRTLWLRLPIQCLANTNRKGTEAGQAEHSTIHKEPSRMELQTPAFCLAQVSLLQSCGE